MTQAGHLKLRIFEDFKICAMIIWHFPLGGSVCTPGRQSPDQSTTNLAELRKIATFLMKKTIFNGHPVFYKREKHTNVSKNICSWGSF